MKESKMQPGEQELQLVGEPRPSMSGWVFTGMCLISLVINWDGGILPAAITVIMREFEIANADGGLLGGLVYLGLVFACPLSATVLNTVSERLVVVCCLVLNIAALVGFLAMSMLENKSTMLLFLLRALTGFSQGPFFVYCPVWIDKYAPPDSVALWMSLYQATTALGIMMGYVLTSTLMAGTTMSSGWRLAFVVQIGTLCVVMPFLLRTSRKYFNVNGHYGQLKRKAAKITAMVEAQKTTPSETPHAKSAVTPAEAEPKKMTTLEQFRVILGFPTHICSVVVLDFLYFVVSGIQFWVTNYMVNVIGAPLAKAQTAFAVVAITAPLFGVIVGGQLVDRCGGYKESGAAALRTLKICMVFAVGAVGSTWPAAFATTFWGEVICIFSVLFWGGALLPPLSGYCIAAVPKHTRTVASAWIVTSQYLLGYTASPIIMGVIADAFVDHADPACGILLGGNYTQANPPPMCASEIEGLTYGYRTCMFSANPALLAMMMVIYAQWRVGDRRQLPYITEERETGVITEGSHADSE